MSPKPEIVVRFVGELWVDPYVQRALKPSRVAKLAGDFKPEAMGVITTSARTSGRIHIVDGQHRYRAAETAKYDGPIQTLEYRGLTVPEEAALFRMLNDADTVTIVDQFLLSCVEENPDSLRLAKFIESHGWKVGPSTTNTTLSAVRSLERLYKIDPNSVDRSLGTVTAAWGRRAAAVQGALLEGVGRVYAKYGNEVDTDNMIKKLAGFPGGPEGLIGVARGQVLTHSGGLPIQVARITVGTYNSGKRTNKLPDWQ